MRNVVIILCALLLALAIAQETGTERIIRIESEGASISGNLRYGPHVFEHPDPEGIRATVSNLTIFSSRATLRVPEEEQDETLLAQAQGRREASFEGGVRVERGRLDASGPNLDYSEATGLGTLRGGVEVRIEPAEAEGKEAQEEQAEPVEIVADEVEFDVDTDRSISRGNVQLVSGNQTANSAQLLFEEERSLGCLYGDGEQVTVTRTDEAGDELVITADEACVLTEEDRLYARGNVTIVDGSITSTGDELFFDDEQSLAEIIGSPARSVDSASGSELESARIRQDIEFDFFEAIDASEVTDFDPAAFEPTAQDS